MNELISRKKTALGALKWAAALAIAFVAALALRGAPVNIAYASESNGALTPQSADLLEPSSAASKTCALYTSKGTLERCTASGKQASGMWFDVSPYFDVKTLYIASDVKSIGSVTYVQTDVNTTTEEFSTAFGQLTKVVFLANGKGVNSCASIPADAFRSQGNLKAIVGLDKTSVKKIGANAFGSCTKLASIALPASLKKIGKDAFNGCYKLKSVAGFGSTKVKSIPESAFTDCKKLKKIVLPKACKTIGAYAFEGCKALKRATFDDNLKKVGDYAFSGCKKLKTADIPAKASVVGKGAFAGCKSLKKVVLRSERVAKTNYEEGSSYAPFDNTPIAKASSKACIYVPEALVPVYQANGKWAVYQSKFRAL